MAVPNFFGLTWRHHSLLEIFLRLDTPHRVFRLVVQARLVENSNCWRLDRWDSTFRFLRSSRNIWHMSDTRLVRCLKIFDRGEKKPLRLGAGIDRVFILFLSQILIDLSNALEIQILYEILPLLTSFLLSIISIRVLLLIKSIAQVPNSRVVPWACDMMWRVQIDVGYWSKILTAVRILVFRRFGLILLFLNLCLQMIESLRKWNFTRDLINRAWLCFPIYTSTVWSRTIIVRFYHLKPSWRRS